MRLSKALFVLPTLFTLTSVFMGLVSLVSAAEGNFKLSAVTILFAIVFDSIDGGVARLTRTQSKFGMQIDSLADVISFGVAPAVLVYLALLKNLVVVGQVDLGLVAAFIYLGAGAIRLARYNVEAERKSGPVKMFNGLPIPGAAGCLAGLVLGLVTEGRTLGAVAATMFLLLFGLLMVSSVKYRKKMTFKKFDTQLILGLLGTTLLIVFIARPAFLLFSFFAFYTCTGLVETVVRRLFQLARRIRSHRRRFRNRYLDE